MPTETIDKNQDGVINKSEFKDWFNDQVLPKNDNLPATVDQSFDALDTNDDGVITPEEVTPEEEQRWNDHFEAKNSPSTEVAIPETEGQMQPIVPPPSTQTATLDGLPAPGPEPQTEPQGEMQSIRPYPPVAIGTRQMDRGPGADIGENHDWKLPLIRLGITHQGGLDLNTNGDFLPNDDPTSKGITWDDTKNALQKLGDIQPGIVGSTTLDGIQEDDFNPEVENPSYSTGHAIEPPETGKAETSAPLAKIGSATEMFNRIMNSGGKGLEMPSTPNKVGARKGSTLAKMAKQKSGLTQNVKQTPLNLKNGKKLNIAQGKENIYERIIDKVSKNYQHWPVDKDGVHYKEKGVVAIYVRGDWISVKYGSYRKTLLDTFAQEHPQFLPQVLEVVES